MERLAPFQQPAVLLGEQVGIPEVGLKAPIDFSLLDVGGIGPYR